MPPSGYDMTQADAIVSFLRSCSQALRRESQDRGETFSQSLAREIGGIERFVANERPSTVQSAVLELTGRFYAMTLEKISRDVDFAEAVEDALFEVSAEVRRIHVAELA